MTGDDPDSQTESVVLHMADIHYGKETNSYSPQKFITRMDAVGKRMVRIKNLLGDDYKLTELVVSIAGDANDGTGIYKTQDHHQTITDVEKQANDLANILTKWLLWQKRVWGSVRVEAVPGNHGRAGQFAHEASNWDRTCYRYLSKNLKGQIEVNFEDADNPFIRKFRVRGHDYLLYHGHDIRSYANIPYYGIMVRVLRWSASRLAPFDVVLMGHFHTCSLWPINKYDVLLSGTMATDDEWSLQTFGLEAVPRWWMFGVSDSRPTTWMYRLDLR